MFKKDSGDVYPENDNICLITEVGVLQDNKVDVADSSVSASYTKNTLTFQVMPNKVPAGWSGNFYVYAQVGGVKYLSNKISMTVASKCADILKSNAVPEQNFSFDHQNKEGDTGLTPIETLDTTNCKIDTCGIYKADGSSYTGGNIVISKTTNPQFKLFFKTNIDAGYTESLTLECSTENGEQTMTSPVFKVTQTNKCATVLSKGTIASFNIFKDYSTSDNGVLTSFGVESGDSSLCPMDKCKLLAADKNAYTGQASIAKNSGGKWEVNYKTTVLHGYESKFIVECSTKNDLQTLQSDLWTVTQYDKCRKVLTKENIAESFKFPWLKDATEYALPKIGILNSDEDNCPISCKLLADDNKDYAAG